MERSNLKGKERLQARKKAYKIWEKHKLKGGRAVQFKTLEKKTGLTYDEIVHYQNKDQWQERYMRRVAEGKNEAGFADGLTKTKYKATKEEIDQFHQILEDSGLSEQKKQFIAYYLQSYNSRIAAIKAGYAERSANVKGSMLLKEPVVQDTLNDVKRLMHQTIYIGAHDVIDEYVKIAFADMTDYVQFDDQEVTLKDSNQVDGRMITEVKRGREGITIKLADKMKALDKLEKLFEILPDKRLELDREKFEFSKKLANGEGGEDSKVVIVNDIG